MYSAVKIIIIILFSLTAVFSQKDYWKPLIEKEGLSVSFIYYTEADNINNGVVIRLKNKNDYSIDYRFTLIFRSEENDTTEMIQGRLKPDEIIAGSSDNLFFIPFRDKSDIYELGISDFKVTKNKL